MSAPAERPGWNPTPWQDPGNGNVVDADGAYVFSVPRGHGSGASARRDATIARIVECVNGAASAPALADALRKIDQKTEHLNYIPELAPHAAIIQGLCRAALAAAGLEPGSPQVDEGAEPKERA